MISINQIKYLNSLKQQKFRKANLEFIVEGEKNVNELLKSSWEISNLYALESWILENETILKDIIVEPVSEKELERISLLKTPNKVLAVAKIQEQKLIIDKLFPGLILMLDNISDPGNLGTIIRIADWYGIKNIICSNQTVELYNPKVIQATMGSFTRVNVYYENLEDVLGKIPKKIPVYGSFMDGENIAKTKLDNNAIAIIGSESQGISQKLLPFINKKIAIPSYNNEASKAESLNASIATAIICHEFLREF
ncbi:MAG: RNA methyltransferase [Saprospiraceae bacterium]|nr:RNA methyltransferase [Saprospiraceae bacterium]